MIAQPRRLGTVGSMNACTENDTVTLSLVLTAPLAQMLCTDTYPNFWAEQPDRFELLGQFNLPLPNDPVFAGGSLNWCATAADALLFRAYEEACGHTVTLLWDLAHEDGQGHVVLSSRPFASPA